MSAIAAPFNRPGVSDVSLAQAGCHHFDENGWGRLYGFKAAGMAIPFRDIRGQPILDNGKPYARVRLPRNRFTELSPTSWVGWLHLCAAGNNARVKGVLLRVRGQKSGVRLFDMASVRAFIHAEMTTSAKERN